MLRINSVRAKAFRGIRWEKELVMNGRSLLLLGENGTGKSSFVEAIEYALTRDISTLSDRGQYVSMRRHCDHVLCDSKERLVEVVIGNSELEVSINPEDETTDYPQRVQRYLRGAAGGNFILRRRTLLNFVEAKDSDRYQNIRPFLGLERFEAFEESLKEAKQEAEKHLQQCNREVQALEGAARRLFNLQPTALVDQPSLFALTNAVLAKCSVATVNDAADLVSRQETLKSQLASLGNTQAHASLFDARTRLKDFIDSVPPDSDVSKVQEAYDALAALESNHPTGPDGGLLSKGQKWLQDSQSRECPICEQAIDTQMVLTRLSERLLANASLIEAHELASTAVKDLRSKLLEAKRLQVLALDAWKRAGLEDSEWSFHNWLTACEKLQQSLADNGTCDLSKYAAAAALWDAEDKIKPRRLSEKKIADRIAGLPDRDSIENLLEAQKQCDYLVRELPSLLRSRDALSKASCQHRTVSQLHDTAVRSRKQACKEVFKAIKDDIEDIYGKFHPDEVVGGFTLDMKEAGTGSAVLKGNFGRKTDEDVRAYYSEAHQDTLGLAVFLALCERASKPSNEFRLIVLDDVLASVDGQHRLRVAEYLIGEVAKKSQVIITTHSRQWYEWLVRLQSRLGMREFFTNRRISDWSLEDGPVVGEVESDYDRLRRIKDTEPHEHLIAPAGFLLETLLQGLRFSMRLSVPAKRDELYTIGDIWDAFQSKCRKCGGWWDVAGNSCEVLDSTAILRNWGGAHSNEWAKDLTRKEVLQFVEPVLQLHDAVFCRECHSFVHLVEMPRGDASCRCGGKRYSSR